MAKKLPSLFKKPLKEKKFRSSILKNVEIPSDRSFLESCFVLENGSYRAREDLDTAALKRLGVLAKAIKANRGAVKTVPLALALILLGGLVLFTLVFMNPLLERVAESGLEAAFEAKAEVDGLRLDLLKFRFSVASVAVADRDKPMTNLFTTGPLVLSLNPTALFRGKVYIEEGRAASLAFGTPRKTSGALPGVAAKVSATPAKASAGAPPLVDFANFDAMALLEQEKDKLAVNAAYAEALAAYDAAAQKWKSQGGDTRAQAAELQNAAKPLLALKVQDLKDPKEALAAAKDAQALSAEAGNAAKTASGIVSGMQTDLDAAKTLEKNVRQSYDEDLKRLKAYIDPSSGAAMEALEPAFRDILSESAERYIAYGQRALELADKLRSLQSDEGNKASKGSSKAVQGRNVAFPSVSYPLFRLGLLAADFSDAGYAWDFSLRELSSDPDLVDEPTVMNLAVKGQDRSYAFDGKADLRAAAAERFAANFSAAGLPVDLGQALSSYGVGSFRSSASVEARGTGAADGGLSALADIDLSGASLGDPTGTLAQALADAVSRTDPLKAKVLYEAPAGKDARFTLKTNLDDLVAAAVKAVAARYAKQASAELEKALRSYAADKLEGKYASKAELDALFSAAKGDKAAVDSLTKGLDDKKAQLEAKAKSLAEDAAKKAAGSAAGSIPKVEVPKVKF